ncbi:MAG: hypothetical protein HDS31_03100 [Bacteroides sp.]|nr:hypothetical protein [Bacteroides sp.]
MKKLYPVLVAAVMGTSLALAADPVIPARYDVTTDSPYVTVDQYDDEDIDSWAVYVEGVTTEENVTVTFKIPEGWDNVVASASDIGILLKQAGSFFGEDKRAPQKDDPEFLPIEFYTQMMGEVLMGPSFTVPADGNPHVYTCFLALDDEIDIANGFMLVVTVKQGEAPELEFPESFNVTADSNGVTIDQYIDEDTDALTIDVSGTTVNDDVVLTFALPAGWSGLIGSEISFGGMKKAREDWPSVEDFRNAMGDVELVEGNQLVFPADGQPHIGQYFLVADGQVDVEHGFVVSVLVEKGEEPGPVIMPDFPETLNVTVSDPGLTVKQEYEAGSDVLKIIVTGETEADEVKVTFDLPEEWAGLIGSNEIAAVSGPVARAAWPTLEEFKENYPYDDLEQGTEFAYPVGMWILGTYYLYTADGYVYKDQHVGVSINVNKKSGVAAVGADTTDVRYYNLRGAEVENPAAGIYIKVTDGHATKVIVK